MVKEIETDRCQIHATSVNTPIYTHACVSHLMPSQKDDDITVQRIHPDCDHRALTSFKKQLEIHELLHERYVSGEISKDNAFCKRLEGMKETRKTLLQNLYERK